VPIDRHEVEANVQRVLPPFVGWVLGWCNDKARQRRIVTLPWSHMFVED